jgi:hypothetical protein
MLARLSGRIGPWRGVELKIYVPTMQGNVHKPRIVWGITSRTNIGLISHDIAEIYKIKKKRI